MSLEVIYIVRHGFRSGWTVDPTTGVYTSHIPSPTGIPTDPALTSHGTRQAEELGRHLLKICPAVDVVYSSPYYRCLQTITPFVNLRRHAAEQATTSPAPSTSSPPTTSATSNSSVNGMIRPEHGIREWFGSAPWNHPEPAGLEVLKPMFPALCDDGLPSAKIPSSKGETLHQLYERVAATLRVLIARADEEGQRAILLCSHAATIIAMGRVLTGQIPDDPETDDFKAFTCGLSVYRRTRRDSNQDTIQVKGPRDDDPGSFAFGGWDCELNGDCSFLANGAERGWKFTGDESFPGTGSMSNDPEAKL